jgi:cytochrome b pre-mRNA-processing protein 3
MTLAVVGTARRMMAQPPRPYPESSAAAMILSLFRKTRDTPSVERVYAAIVAASRAPRLYGELGVPDTVMGRFESLALHLGLTLRRLKELPEPADSLAQELVDRFFAGLDSAMREIGIGDVSVPKKVKKLGQAFYGRVAAYDAALAPEAGADDLEQALARNVLDMPDRPGLAAALAREIRAKADKLAAADFAHILAEGPFPPPEAAT